MYRHKHTHPPSSTGTSTPTHLLLNVQVVLHFSFDGQRTRVSCDELVEVAVHVVLPQEVVVAEVEEVTTHVATQLCGEKGRWKRWKVFVTRRQCRRGSISKISLNKTTGKTAVRKKKKKEKKKAVSNVKTVHKFYVSKPLYSKVYSPQETYHQ